jgi:hypothetical protein
VQTRHILRPATSIGELAGVFLNVDEPISETSFKKFKFSGMPYIKRLSASISCGSPSLWKTWKTCVDGLSSHVPRQKQK